MPVIESKLDVRSEQFARNQADMLETLGELDALYQEAARGGGEEFAILFADTPLSEAARLCEEIRERIENERPVVQARMRQGQSGSAQPATAEG